jgi:1-aminocyclopropane-1-carboxylate deaminase
MEMYDSANNPSFAAMDAIDYAKTYRPAGSPVQEVADPLLEGTGVRLLIKRDDLIHEHISGNKWHKLKYNLAEAVQQNHHTILTFGGAYSNHIAATAFACKKAGMESIGIIRGEYDATNPTLQFARENGMQLEFVSRDEYRVETLHATSPHPEQTLAEQTLAEQTLAEQTLAEQTLAEQTLHATSLQRFGRCFIIPEGGANGLGVRGCAEILTEVEEHFDVVCCAAGTGTTLAGLAISLKTNQKLLGFPALKGGNFLMDEVQRLIGESQLRPPATMDYGLSTDYHFGGYAKMKPELLAFINGFTKRTGIPLDPIYTGKMMFGIYDMILKPKPVGAYGNTPDDGNTPFPKETTILAIHTGGLQGWKGMKHRGLV